MTGLNNILFLDVETVPQELEFIDLPAHGKDTFTKRFRSAFDKILSEDAVSISNPASQANYELEVWQQVYERNVSTLAEYARVACVSLGMVDSEYKLRLQTFSGPDENELLMNLSIAVCNTNVLYLCAHNGKAFDFPFLVRRYLINGMMIPQKLKIMGLKPWDMKWIYDTMEMWNLGDLRYNCSLDRLAYAFGVPSPKGDMDGSKVAQVYYSDDPDRFKKIGTYCQGDVVVLACVYARMVGAPLPVNLTNPTSA